MIYGQLYYRFIEYMTPTQRQILAQVIAEQEVIDLAKSYYYSGISTTFMAALV
jgi:hypothetical protein